MITHLARKAHFWIALLCVVGGIGTIGLVAYHHHKESKLEDSGEVIIGTVDSKRIEITPEAGARVENFLVAYRFEAPDGSSRSGEGKVDRSFYDSIEAGDEIEVLYDTNDPSRHRLVATEPVGGILAMLFVAAGVLFALIGLLLLRTLVRGAAEERA